MSSGDACSNRFCSRPTTWDLPIKTNQIYQLLFIWYYWPHWSINEINQWCSLQQRRRHKPDIDTHVQTVQYSIYILYLYYSSVCLINLYSYLSCLNMGHDVDCTMRTVDCTWRTVKYTLGTACFMIWNVTNKSLVYFL